MEIYNDKNYRAWLDENIKQPYSFGKLLNKALDEAEKGKSWVVIPPTKTKDGKRKKYYFTVSIRDDGEMIVEF